LTANDAMHMACRIEQLVSPLSVDTLTSTCNTHGASGVDNFLAKQVIIDLPLVQYGGVLLVQPTNLSGYLMQQFLQ
jgi:hypothetical protein